MLERNVERKVSYECMSEATKRRLQEIIEHVKANGNAVKWEDSPFMPFAAEWQDWSRAAPQCNKLIIGYCEPDESGDLVCDPVFYVDLTGSTVNGISMTTLMFSLPLANPADIGFFGEFLSLVWNRHFKRRIGLNKAAETEGGS